MPIVRDAHLVADAVVPTPARLPPPWPGETVLVDGQATYVRYTPATGPHPEPAVYVHGLGGSGQNWTDLADLLSHWLDGQAIDLPGFGRSEPARRYTLPALASRVIRLLEHADRGPVHLFGNSLGGAVSVVVAARRPDLVRTLTLISPAMPFVDPRRSVQGRFVPLLLLPRAEWLAARQLARVTPEELTRQVTQWCVADPGALPDQRMAEAIEEAQRRLETPWYADVYIRTLRAIVTSFLRAYLPGAGSLWRLAARVEVPTLVVWGREDRMVDVSLAPRVARTIPDSRLLVCDNVGHVAQMEAPRLVARALVAMLDEQRPGRREARSARAAVTDRPAASQDRAAGE